MFERFSFLTGDIGDTGGIFVHVKSNPLCRQGLKVPKEPSMYSCAEPMLGRYVYIQSNGRDERLQLCDVKVYLNSKLRQKASFGAVTCRGVPFMFSSAII